MKNALQLSSMSLPIGSLDAYMLRANSFPVLSAQEEHDLSVKFREFNDLEAARKLVMSHLRFVVKIAKGYMGYGLSLGDLIQEGNVGLMKAVKKFDPTVGVRLVSFAVHWIKAEMHEFILKNWRIVKIATTKAQRKLFFNLRSAKKRLGWFSKEEITDVAQTLNVREKDVLEMEARLNNYDAALETHPDEDTEHSFKPIHYLTADKQFNPAEIFENESWQKDVRSRLQIALQKLDERSRDILQSRWLTEKKTTLQTLAKKYQISAERIRQLEQMALNQLKSEMLH